MREIVEHTQVAAAPGRVWQVLTTIARPGARDDRVVRARSLAWSSSLPDGTEVHRWFTLAPSWQGTELEHGCRAEVDDVEIARRDALRAEVVATLSEVKALAEGG